MLCSCTDCHVLAQVPPVSNARPFGDAKLQTVLCVVAGAAAGGASVRGDEVKECLLGMVGRDKAKLEACFALEQVVFRAVLAGQ